jgi:hypothetical protein
MRRALSVTCGHAKIGIWPAHQRIKGETPATAGASGRLHHKRCRRQGEGIALFDRLRVGDDGDEHDRHGLGDWAEAGDLRLLERTIRLITCAPITTGASILVPVTTGAISGLSVPAPSLPLFLGWRETAQFSQ